ncbi:hypothetical protein [Nonomuraea typhae]|uniref:hypothetical protein n=1 Tax=Nonomuraea typhae TaxID=2603600 RepID=UPI0012F995CC|nr:hypothetical protein [Nonomuraea typhae]
MWSPPPDADAAIREHLVYPAEIARRTGVTRGAVGNWMARYPTLAGLAIVELWHGGAVFWWPQVAAELERLGLPDHRYGKRKPRDA